MFVVSYDTHSNRDVDSLVRVPLASKYMLFNAIIACIYTILNTHYILIVFNSERKETGIAFWNAGRKSGDVSEVGVCFVV